MPATRRRSDRGAAALEFGLLVPLLLLILFGTIQYGLYFNDSLSAKQGVRDGVRQGVVKSFPSCDGASDDLARLRCFTRARIGALTGQAYVKVVAPSGWDRGDRLLVCAVVKSEGGAGLLPMPNGGLINTKTEMSIEMTGEPSGTTSADTLPIGADWSWCT